MVPSTARRNSSPAFEATIEGYRKAKQRVSTWPALSKQAPTFCQRSNDGFDSRAPVQGRGEGGRAVPVCDKASPKSTAFSSEHWTTSACYASLDSIASNTPTTSCRKLRPSKIYKTRASRRPSASGMSFLREAYRRQTDGERPTILEQTHYQPSVLGVRVFRATIRAIKKQ